MKQFAAPLNLEWFGETRPSLDQSDFVEGLLGEGQLSVLYGESGCGKTFFATDLALHVALGREWRGRDVERGGVVYVAAEGGFGVRNRLAAFRQHFQIEDDAPFALARSPIDLLREDGDRASLSLTIEEAANRTGCGVSLVILDTLSRVLAGGNENSSEDMGALVRNVDQIRDRTGAHVMFIHHSGKDAARGARGHSLLRAATDTEIEVCRDQALKVSTARVTKQRDMEEGAEFPFSLLSVTLGENRRSKTVTSCVVQVEEAPTPTTRNRSLSGSKGIALKALRNAVLDAGEPHTASNHVPQGVQTVPIDLWRRYAYAAGISGGEDESAKRKAFGRARDALINSGHVAVWNDAVWIAE